MHVIELEYKWVRKMLYIKINLKFLLLSLMSSHSLRPSIYLLSPSKLAFHYSPAWEIVSRIMPVTSGDFSYSYFTCNMSIKESICTLQTQSIDIGIDHRKPHHLTSYCLNMAHDWIQPYQIMQTIGNSAECCDDVGSIYFICNMSMKESR